MRPALPRTPFSALRFLVMGALSLVITACGGGGGSSAAPPPTPPATLTTLSLSPAAPSLAPGATRQITATGAYSDGTT